MESLTVTFDPFVAAETVWKLKGKTVAKRSDATTAIKSAVSAITLTESEKL